MHNSCVAESACFVPTADHGRYACVLSSAADFAKALGTAAQHDNGHIVSLASSPSAGSPIRQIHPSCGRSLWGKENEISHLLARLAGLTTISKLQMVHKENPAGGAITKLLTAFELKPDHQRYFIQAVGGEEAEATLPAQPMTCEPVKQPHTSQAATSSSSRLGKYDIKRADSFNPEHAWWVTRNKRHQGPEANFPHPTSVSSVPG